MDIYIPYYDRGWHIQPAKADKARKLGGYWSYCGWIYGPNAYTTEDGAQAYIDKQYGEARISEYKAVTA
jgi:hypothetical protein